MSAQTIQNRTVSVNSNEVIACLINDAKVSWHSTFFYQVLVKITTRQNLIQFNLKRYKYVGNNNNNDLLIYIAQISISKFSNAHYNKDSILQK